MFIIDVKALQIIKKKLTLLENKKYGQADISLKEIKKIVKKSWNKIIKAMQMKRNNFLIPSLINILKN